MTVGKFMDLSLEGFTSVRILGFPFNNDNSDMIINIILEYDKLDTAFLI